MSKNSIKTAIPKNKQRPDSKNSLPSQIPLSSYEIGASFNSSLINVINSIIGAGILSIPFVIHSTGLIGSLLLLILTYILSMFGCYYLIVASYYSKRDSYGGIAKVVYNDTVAILSDIVLIIYALGISTAYNVILFEQVLDLLQSWSSLSAGILWNYRYYINIAVTLVFTVPLLCLRNLDGLKYASFGAVICIVLFVCISLYLGIHQLVIGPLAYNLLPTSANGVAASIAVFSSALCFHINIPRMVTELRISMHSKYQTKIRKMYKVGILAASFSAILYYLVGVFAYFAYGEGIAGNLLSNFHQMGYWYLGIVKLAYAFVVLFSNPVNMYPTMITVMHYTCRDDRRFRNRFIVAFIWALIVCLIATLIPQLEVVFGLTGSTGGILLIYVLPSYYYIGVVDRIRKRSEASGVSLTGPRWLYGFAYCLILLSIIMGAISTISQLMALK